MAQLAKDRIFRVSIFGFPVPFSDEIRPVSVAVFAAFIALTLRLSASSLQLSAPHSTLNPNLPLRNMRQSLLSFIFVVNQIIYYYQRRQETACFDNIRVSFISIFAWDWELGFGLGRAGERKKFNWREKKSLSILGDSKEVWCYIKKDRIPMWPLMECDC